MNSRRIKNTGGRMHGLLVVLVAAAAFIGGCSSLHQARQSAKAGEPLRALSLYEHAAAQRPDDPGIQQELTQARQTAAEALVMQAQQAAQRGDYQQASQLAARAATLDAQWRSFEQQLRHDWVDAMLEQAHRALDEQQFQRARQYAQHAAGIAGDRAQPDELLARINRAEAADLAGRATQLADAGKFERALVFAERAASLQPQDTELLGLPHEIDLQRRRATFDTTADRARQAISAGRLSDAATLLSDARSLDVHPQPLAELQSQLEQRWQRVHEALAAARAARDDGRFDEALQHFAVAEQLAVDQADIVDERRAAEAHAHAVALRRTAIHHHDRGEYRQAIELLRESLHIQADDETQQALHAALIAHHRLGMEQALETQQVAAAIDHADEILQIIDDPQLLEQRRQLESALIDDSLRRAQQLAVDGNAEAALDILHAAMQRSDDPHLVETYRSINAESLLQRAIAHDRAHRFHQARRAYLDAFAAANAEDRMAIEERINDVEALAALEAELAGAHDRIYELEGIVADLDHSLAQHDTIISEREHELNHAHHTIHQLELKLSGLSHKLQSERSANHHLHEKIHQLQHRVTQLQRDLQSCRARLNRVRHRH